MKVAHINPGVRGLGTYALNLYNYFTKRNVDTLVISGRKWNKQKIPVYEPKSTLFFGVIPWIWDVKGVKEKLLEFKPDILHYHHPSANLDFYAEEYRKMLNVPLVTTIHMSVGAKKYFVDKFMHLVYQTVKKNYYNGCIVAISQYVKKQLLDMGDFPPEKIVLLYAGVDPEIYKPLPKNNSGELEITFCGQIVHEKGIDYLIDTVIEAQNYRKIRLNIIGEGVMKNFLVRKTKKYPFINWVGYLSNPYKVAEYYAKSDAVILPNRWEEAFSYIPIESLSCGTAVIATNLGGNTEIIKDDWNGYLFDISKKNSLLEILKKVNIEKLHEMGMNGREHILKHHTLELFGQKYNSLYENLLNDPSNIKQID